MSEMTNTVSQREYLKKYLSGTDMEKKKKKKKDKVSSLNRGMRIIEDSVDFKSVPYGYKAEDDAPTVAEVTYDDPKLKVMEQFEANKKWKKLEKPGSTSWAGISKGEKDLSPIRRMRHDSPSPPRSGNKGDSVTRWKSPPLSRRVRHDSDSSPQRKGRSDSDDSPPRRKRRHDSDSSPIRPDSLSPPRRNAKSLQKLSKLQRHDSESPLKRSRPESRTPPQRVRHESDSPRPNIDDIDLPPFIRMSDVQGGDSDDGSYTPPYPPPNVDAGSSLSGKPGKNEEEDPPMLSKGEEITVTSDLVLPPRSKWSSPSPSPSPPPAATRRKRHDSDAVPQKRRHDTDTSPPRRKRHDSDASPPRSKKHDAGQPPAGSRLSSGTGGKENKPSYDTILLSSDSDSSSSKIKKKKKKKSSGMAKQSQQQQQQQRQQNAAGGKRGGVNTKTASETSAKNKLSRWDPEPSPPRRKRHDSDESPPRKKGPSSSFNSSPQTKKQYDSDASPPRQRKPGSDSPPLRRKRHDSDNSPVRRKRDSDSDASPPRMKKTGKKGMSPPFKKKGGQGDGAQMRPERKMTTQEYLVARKKGRLKKDTPEDIARKEREAVLQQQAEEKNKQWKHGMKQVQDYQKKVASDAHEMNKAFTRTADDADMNTDLKMVARKEDPMLEYLVKKEAKGNKTPLKPMYKGSFPPNRLNIRPGYRWDGVDRSSGFEKRWFEHQNNKKAHKDDAYKWSVSDM